MVPALLTHIGLPLLVRWIAGSLRDIEHPASQEAAQALDYVDEALTYGQITPDQLKTAQDHLRSMAELEARQVETALQEINTSLRAEIVSNDKYIRRMRPTFGYLMAFTWAAQMFALAYIIIFKTERAAVILEATASLGAIWAVGLSVLGIYVYRRSEEKKGSFNFTRPPFYPSFYHSSSFNNSSPTELEPALSYTASSRNGPATETFPAEGTPEGYAASRNSAAYFSKMRPDNGPEEQIQKREHIPEGKKGQESKPLLQRKDRRRRLRKRPPVRHSDRFNP